MKPTNLRTEYFLNPIGIDSPLPRLSWCLPSGIDGLTQSAYQILASSHVGEDSGDLWDLGKVESNQSIHVQYGGKALKSRARVNWKVRFWDQNGKVSDWSNPAFFETGLMKETDWSAKWIGGHLIGGRKTSVPIPAVRKSFTLDKNIKSARLYIAALGVYECTINRKRVGDYYLSPGWTDFSKRVAYQAFDVTSHLKKGENVIGALIGDGWYAGFLRNYRQHYGTQPKLIAQLEVQLEDGSRAIINSDESWKTYSSAILEADLYMGESYDARLEQKGWEANSFNDSKWFPVQVFNDISTIKDHLVTFPIRKIETIKPTGEPIKKGNSYIFDMGQNMVGWIRFKLQSKPGSTVIIRHAEVINRDGTLNTDNLGAARSTDIYTFASDKTETWEPRFTFHGFRYVELKGTFEPPTRDSIEGIVLHTDMAFTGKFECSDPLINKLQMNIQWGQRGNMLDVPTDCPQRDERLGWTGDAQVFVRTACFNMDVASFFAKYIRDLCDAQYEDGSVPCIAPNSPDMTAGGIPDGGPAWADAIIICPWTIYRYYGDKKILEDSYDSCRAFIDLELTKTKDFIRCHPEKPGWGYGDWLALDGSSTAVGNTPKDLIGTAFLAYDAKLMSQIAEALGKNADAKKYLEIFEKVKSAYQKRYITSDGLVFGGTQTSYVLTLHFDLAPSEQRAALVQNLARDIRQRGNRLSTGFVGTPYLLHVLSEAGEWALATELLFQKKCPSWLHTVTRGATTIWERWDSYTDEGGFSKASYNHYAYGAVGDWMYSNIAGIDLDKKENAFKKSLLRPTPIIGLDYASAELETPYGKLVSRWELKNTTLMCHFEIPANTTATLQLPTSNGESIKVGHEKVTPETIASDGIFTRAVIQLAPGKHEVSVEYKLGVKATITPKGADKNYYSLARRL